MNEAFTICQLAFTSVQSFDLSWTDLMGKYYNYLLSVYYKSEHLRKDDKTQNKRLQI